MINRSEYVELANKLNHELAQCLISETSLRIYNTSPDASPEYTHWCAHFAFRTEHQDGMTWMPGVAVEFAKAVKDDLSFVEAMMVFEEFFDPTPIKLDWPKADRSKTSLEEYADMRSWEIARYYTADKHGCTEILVSFLKQCKALLLEEKEPVGIRCELYDGSVKEWSLEDRKKLAGLGVALSESQAIILE